MHNIDVHLGTDVKKIYKILRQAPNRFSADPDRTVGSFHQRHS